MNSKRGKRLLIFSMTLGLAVEAGRVKEGDRCALMGIGSGLSCAMMEVVW